MIPAIKISFVLALMVSGLMVKAADPEEVKEPNDSTAVSKYILKPLTASKSVLPLKKEGGLWIDLKRKWVIVDGSVCLREGPLEMFICPAQTKEHESVITTPVDAETVHTSLLAIGAKTGSPVQFQPEYKRASGAVIDIAVVWVGGNDKIVASLAQDWIKVGNTRKTMQYAWVFGGSGYWKNPNTGKTIYYGNDGSLVCLSNFPTATIDLPVESSNSNAARLYYANTSKIAPLKTSVRVILVNRTGVDVTKVPKVLGQESTLLDSVRKWAAEIGTTQ
ncbi:MAG: hypothetical protein HOB73_02905 [Planctomycetaceae bacterium]|jgi:hypothetical protein|nr:hypothetical protein [Planctomycetaceae bacterium]